MKQYKTTLKHRLSQKKYRELHKKEQDEAAKKWKINHPEQVKLLQLKHSKINNPKSNRKKILFKGGQVWIGYNPRSGICSKCKRSVHKGEIKKTNLHHTQYDENNPLAHTIELCVSCHIKEHNIWNYKK